MEDLGYNSSYMVLNAKDFGVPQNRERVFTVSIRNDMPYEFKFPTPTPLTKRLRDILEPEVDERFFLNETQISRMKTTTYHCSNIKVRLQGDVANTLCARDYKDPKCVRVGGLYDSETTRHQAGSIYDPEGISATLSTMQGGNQEPLIVNDYRIRKLTPRECWRLMGFSDASFDRAQAAGISNSQLYKQAGNSIVVSVLEAILKNLL